MMATAADGGTPPRAKSPATAPHPLKGRPRPPESHAPRAVPARRTPPASPPTGVPHRCPPTGVPPPVSPHRCPPSTGVPPRRGRSPAADHATAALHGRLRTPGHTLVRAGPRSCPFSAPAPSAPAGTYDDWPARANTPSAHGSAREPPAAAPRHPRGTACRGQGADAGATVPFSKRVTGAWARASSSRRPDHTRNPVPSPGRAAQGRPRHPARPVVEHDGRGRPHATGPHPRTAPPRPRPHPGGPGPAPRPVAGAGCPAGEAPLTARSPARAAGRITGGPLPPSDGHQCREGSGGRGQDGSVPPGEQGSRPRHVGLQPELLQHLVGGADRRGDHRLADGVLHLLDRRQ